MSRFLADENFPGSAVSALRASGHEVEWIRDSNPGIADIAIIALASRKQQTILTFDKDFGELAFARGLPSSSGIVLFRLPMAPPHVGISRIVATLLSRPEWSGSFWVVEPGRIRQRRLLMT